MFRLLQNTGVYTILVMLLIQVIQGGQKKVSRYQVSSLNRIKTVISQKFLSI